MRATARAGGGRRSLGAAHVLLLALATGGEQEASLLLIGGAAVVLLAPGPKGERWRPLRWMGTCQSGSAKCAGLRLEPVDRTAG